MAFEKGHERFPGAGRRPGRKVTKKITIALEPEIVDKFSTICSKKKFVKAKIIRNLIIDFIKNYEKVLNESEEVSEEVFES